MPETIYTFGPFRLFVEERRLVRQDELVPLRDKVFDMLVLFVEHAGRIVSKQTLMERLWRDVVVDENNIAHNMSVLRKALEGGAEIETIRAQGYRLLAEVRREAAGEAGPRDPAGRLFRQHIRFCTASDGARIAYARLGSGQPLVKAANWLNHLELDFGSPVWRHWLELFARDRALVRYDARGTGLSSWNVDDISFEGFVRDLEAVVDAAGLDRFPLLGVSQGAAVAVAYAARHPERVSALVLLGGWTRGFRVKNRPRLNERMDAILTLMKQGWGRENAAFRQIFTTTFFADASKEQIDSFNELQRLTTTADNAVRFMHALGAIDVSNEVGRVRAPTLVFHAKGDSVIPQQNGIELAAEIPGARFVPLDSPNHILLAHEPAWARFTDEARAFLGEVGA